jgi:hypothetical protein
MYENNFFKEQNSIFIQNSGYDYTYEGDDLHKSKWNLLCTEFKPRKVKLICGNCISETDCLCRSEPIMCPR